MAKKTKRQKKLTDVRRLTSLDSSQFSYQFTKSKPTIKAVSAIHTGIPKTLMLGALFIGIEIGIFFTFN